MDLESIPRCFRYYSKLSEPDKYDIFLLITVALTKGGNVLGTLTAAWIPWFLYSSSKSTRMNETSFSVTK